MAERTDLDRLRKEYLARSERDSRKLLYSRFNPAYLFCFQQLERTLLSLFKKNNLFTLKDLSLLEVGCGSGGVLLQYQLLDVPASNLWGLDIRFDPLPGARNRVPQAIILNANGAMLPVADHSFDLVLQYTAFSSILDEGLKKNMALEMLRVLKPGGFVIWYDFWLNPTNKQTRGIKPAEIRRLFPRCKIQLKRVTLAPPIARRLVPFSWGLAHALESLKFLNSHYLALIQPG